MGHALAIGLVHGPAELLPVSSSGHVTLVPWLLGWDSLRPDPELRKAFEVALHAGSTAGWLLSGGWRALPAAVSSRRRLLVLALMTLPPGAAGLVLERPIERRLGQPPTIAAGLLLGALGMTAADRRPQTRKAAEAGVGDGLWLGVAQACALFPGISRSGAALTAARRRGFRRRDSWQLSMQAATPVIAGAAALKLGRLLRRAPSSRQGASLSAGAAGAFASTLALAKLLRPAERGWPLVPFAAYRAVLALAVLARLTRSGRGSRALRRRTARG
ncbi:MAG: undecaprenyl-diphosphate phosphatase [Solirubrobacteraceae bacterium]